jgi:hypothetical protein
MLVRAREKSQQLVHELHLNNNKSFVYTRICVGRIVHARTIYTCLLLLYFCSIRL